MSSLPGVDLSHFKTEFPEHCHSFLALPVDWIYVLYENVCAKKNSKLKLKKSSSVLRKQGSQCVK